MLRCYSLLRLWSLLICIKANSEKLSLASHRHLRPPLWTFFLKTLLSHTQSFTNSVVLLRSLKDYLLQSLKPHVTLIGAGIDLTPLSFHPSPNHSVPLASTIPLSLGPLPWQLLKHEYSHVHLHYHLLLIYICTVLGSVLGQCLSRVCSWHI